MEIQKQAGSSRVYQRKVLIIESNGQLFHYGNGHNRGMNH
ncbi:hypothetical protein E2C01_058896 [Portunus trituberculatus]|uniref:Uncharacterized protein n=1 Tax=Portunus trituberculatus TaxID=210409 RepID=A0A5B7H5E9_PORTR|nr:hypothetical protein [Portunus trituberculatus]